MQAAKTFAPFVQFGDVARDATRSAPASIGVEQRLRRDGHQRQRAIGLADNARALREAEGQFNHVFTSSFCFNENSIK